MDRLSTFPEFTDFKAVGASTLFQSLPDDWVLGLTDVVTSTKAIAEGRYKAVNMAGAAAIAGMMRALGTPHFAFSFAGDGCVFALPAADAQLAREVLSQTAAWVRDDLQLTLRAALVPLSAVRSEGFDVRAAMYRPTPHVAYAMFDGGGLAFAEDAMKAGRFRIAPSETGARPDLSGLSCRWLPIKSQRGDMVSVIMRPGPLGQDAFRAVMGSALDVLAETTHPVPPMGPDFRVVSPGMSLEARATRGRWPLMVRSAYVAAHTAMGWLLFKSGRRVAGFDPNRYRALTAQNADTKKYGDGLMFTADFDRATLVKLETVLEVAFQRGAVRYGLVRQDAALMTCLLPSYTGDGHFHFIDGAGGGYSAAARAMRNRKSPLPVTALVDS
ncbi:MAG: DUF3095 family protein [Pseudomonadota bacterium]